MSSESRSTRCYTHLDNPAHIQCTRCLEYICEACTLHGPVGLTCPRCIHAISDQKRKRLIVVSGIAIVAVCAVVIALAVSGPGEDTAGDTPSDPAAEPAPDEPGFDYGRYGFQISNLRATLEKNPCAKRVALGLGNKLNAAGDYEGAKSVVSEFFSNCESYTRLLWIKVYAHEQLGEWEQAADIDTELIDERPHDSDFWWWRGKAHAESDNAAQAMADLRQSMAARPNKFASRRIAKYYGEAQPCVAAFALSFYAEQRADQSPQWASRDAERLYLAADCEEMAGTGKTSIKFKQGAPLIKVKVRINGKTGMFAVSEQTAYVTVDQAFADEAGLSAGDETATVFVGEAHTDARFAVADIAVGPAKASRVATAIVSQLPGDVDGILGASFMWRFAYDRMPGEITLVSRDE